MEEKKCWKCQQTKPLSEFYKNRSTRDGLQQLCKGCCKKQTDASVASGKHSQYMKNVRARIKEDPERLAKQRAYSNRKQKERRINDPVWREKSRLASQANYRKNKDRYVARVRERKARLEGSGGSHSSEAWRQLKALFGGKCLCCGRDDARLTRDHVVPITRGGTDFISNIQPLCWRCNKSKFVRDKDYRTRDKVVLVELNEVGRLLFETPETEKVIPTGLLKHKPASRYTGVTYKRKGPGSVKLWRARIHVDGKLICLGGYETEEAAAMAYNKAAKEFYGEFACLNDVPEQTGPGTEKNQRG